MSEVTLGNKAPELSDADRDAIAERGYQFDGVTPLRNEFVASATKVVDGIPYRAQAIGFTRAHAARALVKTITRR